MGKIFYKILKKKNLKGAIFKACSLKSTSKSIEKELKQPHTIFKNWYVCKNENLDQFFNHAILNIKTIFILR